MSRFAISILSSLFLISCSHTPNRYPAGEIKKPYLKNRPDRYAYLQYASILEDVDIPSRNILRGPQREDAFENNSMVNCHFSKAGKHKSGATPKFDCKIKKDKFKVKFTPRNPDEKLTDLMYKDYEKEIYAEVAATRLMWALGFYADTVYPVRVLCKDCPTNPVLGFQENESPQSIYWGESSIERKLDGREMELEKIPGWTWQEMNNLVAGAHQKQMSQSIVNAYFKAQSFDKKKFNTEWNALKLLAAFLKHNDNKADNQRMMCFETVEFQGKTICSQPVIYIQDIGSSFGGGGKIPNRGGKASLKDWASKPVFKGYDAEKQLCQAALTASFRAQSYLGWIFRGGLQDPYINEEGRLLLSHKLDALTDEQIEQIFTVARMDHLKEVKADGSYVTIADWVRVFKEKRDEVRKGCR